MAVGLVLAVVSGGPAYGHATFPGGTTYPTGTDQRLVMDVPHEREPGVYNTAVSVQLPTGWGALSCEAAATWQCQVTAGSGDGRPVIRWTKDAGAPQTPNDETFAFTVHVGAPGSVALPATQTYSTGEIVRWIGSPESDTPAPVLESAPGGVSATTSPPQTTAPPTTQTPPTTRSTSPATQPRTTVAPATSTTSTAVTTTTTVVGATSAPEETTTTTTTTDSSEVTIAARPPPRSSKGSGWPLVLLVVLGAGAAAFAVPAVLRHRRSPGPPGA